MVTVEAINEQSAHLGAVKRLWRAHSDTLGFLPDGAFKDYARERHILVALNGSICVGYLLYRVVRDRVTIAHFCITPECRKQGTARALIKHLVGSTKRYRGISLSCRRDFDANETWPRLGFHVIGEMPGRASEGSELVRWWYDYGHPDMFTIGSEPGALEVAIDSNVFLDLMDSRDEESQGLLADWLRPLVTLCYTAELLNEIDRNKDSATRKKRTGEAQQFTMLQCAPEAFQNADHLLRPLFPSFCNPQDESDFRHLVRAVAAEADAFVTRDGKLLERADEIFQVCGLSVVRPAELIGRIDIIEHERDYQRNFVAGTRQVVQERMNSTDDAILAAIQCSGEQRRTLAATLNRYLASPQRCRCQKIMSNDGATLAVIVVEHDAGVDRVPLLRICAKRQAGTLARAVLTGLIRKAVQTDRHAVFVTDSTISESIQTACSDVGFLPVEGGRLKLVLSGWCTIDEAAASIGWVDTNIDDLKAALPMARTDANVASHLEHLVWPARLADAALPCFIVPIRPQFAEHLFDERLASGSLLGADVDLALNPESAYYRAAKPAVLTCPARVLWYVSESDSYVGTKSIRACSRLVEVLVDRPKRLYSRFRRLGVYEWSHVRETARGDVDKEIMALRFDDSELLRPVPWATFQGILKANGINSNLQSPVSIPASVFGEIYAAAFDSPKVR
jgi:GNAT superfamily N-acetyltransferase/predicted nucleic acid-binding protein